MTAHVVFDCLATATPATLAYDVVTGLLRNELGYQGLIISDDLEMRAIADHYGIEQAACRAIEAGCDTLLICSRVDWVERARTALAERAEADPAFLRRLEDAAERSVQLRRQCPPSPETKPARLERAIDADAAERLAQEIERRAALLHP
jgi:beta-N-acetylhexosaminidase